MATKKNKFTVIIPTYTGAKTIAGCLESILQQLDLRNFEVVVVIDGPNSELGQICKSYKKIFIENEISFKLIQFKKNKGRFAARLAGAEVASYESLLFLDDRITFENDYFNGYSKTTEKIIIPNVYEAEAKNFNSRTLYLLRKKVYGPKKFGTKFKSYYITNENFENSPKGTTSLWIKKEIFLKACKEVEAEAKINKYINEDTKLFRSIVDKDIKILKSGEQVIYYQPRAHASEEIRHLYHRGPRFVDYYIKPGTRFFPVLLASLLGGVFVVTLALFNYVALLYILLALSILIAIISIFLSETKKDFIYCFAGIITVIVVFSAGIYRGLYIKLSKRS